MADFAVLVDEGTAKNAEGAKILRRVIAFCGGAEVWDWEWVAALYILHRTHSKHAKKSLFYG